MQKYRYTAVNLQNKIIKGSFIAKNEKDLAEQLAKQGLYLMSASPYSGVAKQSFFSLSVGSSVKLSELTTFCRQFAIMQNSSIPLLECIDMLKNQPYSDFFKKIIELIYEDVKGGLLLSEALDKHAKVFPDFFRSMVYVGEMSGKLDLIFNALADYYERDAEMKRKLSGAMAYPMMLLGMTIGIVVLMLAFVVPTFKDALADLDVPITGITAAVYSLSDFVTQWWTMILSVIMIIAILIFLFLQTEQGKYCFDYLILNIPLIKTVQINTLTASFARSFSLLLSSGMDLNEALNVVEVVLTNRYMRKRFHVAAENVRQGMSLTKAFDLENLFPPMMIKMIMVGEGANSLDDVLTRSCAYFDTQVETSITSFSSKIQPIMLVFMGLVVGAMFVAVYSPMLSIMNTIA